MKNIKAAATIVAAVAVAGATVQQIIHHRKTEKVVAEFNESIDKYNSAAAAFNKAQDVLTDRMLDGYYDDKTDAEYAHDFDVLYANFLKQK